jgi:ferredoxin-NADP reductase
LAITKKQSSAITKTRHHHPAAEQRHFARSMAAVAAVWCLVMRAPAKPTCGLCTANIRLASIHRREVVNVPGDVPSWLPLRRPMLCNVHGRFRRMKVGLKLILEETCETKSFFFDLSTESFTFIPGQFVNLTAEIPQRPRVRRAYSIASSPLDEDFQLTVKRIEGGVLSTFLCENASVGEFFDIKGPYGIFTLDEHAEQVVFIAAGSGIVPFRSMWRYISQKPLNTKVTLLYASRSLGYIIYREELMSLQRPRFTVVHTLTRNDDPTWTGYSRRIDPEMLLEVVREFRDKLFYVCGPPAMCNCVVLYLKDFGVDRTKIKTEKYD